MAGKIDSLNFEVILNDTKFETTVKKDLELARQLNTSLTEILNVKSKINAGSKSAFIDQQKLAREAAKTAQEKAKEALQWQKVRTEAEKTALANQKVKASIEQASGALAGGGNTILRAWLRFYATLWSIISAIRIFARTVGSAIKKISEFQQANANLATIMQVSRREIETLTNDALMLGRTTEWTASQVTELQTALAKLGYNIPQIRNMQASVLQFATAVGANLPEAANLAGAALRMFGMHSSETQKVLEILTASTNKTALDFDKLKVSLPYVGAIAHSIGLDVAETASLLGVLTNAGLESSRAGTGLRQVLLELSKQGGKLQTAMGGSVKTFDDLVRGLEGMRDRGLEAGEATKLVSTRASSALLILANGVDDIKRLNKEVRETDGLLKDIQSERLNTLHGSTLLLKSAWEGLIQTFRDSAGPMKDVVDWLTKIVRATSLAASRTNRVTQGTSGRFSRGTSGIVGSDSLTNQFKEHYNSLLRNGVTAEEATQIVRAEMKNWLGSAQEALIDAQKKGYKENWFNNFMYGNFLGRVFVGSKMNRGREANEQVEAIENAIDAVNDYMANQAKEGAEIAANNYLEEWKMIFDTQGEKAARAAMKAVAGYEEIKSRMEAYIANGGMAGADDRGKHDDKTPDKTRRDAISDIKNNIAVLEKFKSAYDRLEPVMGADSAREWVFYKMGHDVSNLDAEFEKLIEDLRKLGEDGKQEADALEARLGLGLVDKVVKASREAEKAQKALEKYQTTYRKWASEDFNLGGSGFEYDINKVLSDLNTNLGKVDEKYVQALEEAKEAHKGNAAAIDEEVRKLEALRDAEKEYVRAQAQNSLDKLAESYLKDQYLLRGVNMDNLGDMSLKQLRDLKGELRAISKDALQMLNDMSGIEGFLGSLGMDVENLTEEDIASLNDKLPESTIEMVRLWKAVKDTGLSFDTLTEKIQSAINKGLKNLDEQEKKSIARLGKYAAKQILELADAFRELGEASGNSGMTSAANTLSEIADVAKSAMEGFSQGGWIGAVIGGVVSVAKKFIDAEAEAEKFRQSVIKIREEIRHTNAISQLSSDSIFGTAQLDEIRKAKKTIKEAEKAIYDILLKPKMERGRLVPNPLQEMMSRNGLPLYDENGNIIRESLEGMKELYPDDSRWQELINRLDEYNEALKKVEETSESIVGNVVATLADKIVDSWWEAGSAALDYADILEDVAKAYAKLIVNDMLLSAAFDEQRQDAFKNALKNGDAARAMSIVEQAMQSAQEMLPAVESALAVFEPYRNMSSSTENNSVGSGIKSITEDTANLLASYINAIRSDVSYIRMLQERGLESIDLLGSSVPTLNEHLAQIAATNFDIAQSNQSILSELRSVIGSPGTSGMVVRVESY